MNNGDEIVDDDDEKATTRDYKEHSECYEEENLYLTIIVFF